MNARQKKKRLKARILNVKPYDVCFLYFNMDKIKPDEIQYLMETYEKIIPDWVAIVALPNSIYVNSMSREFAIEELDKIKQRLITEIHRIETKEQLEEFDKYV